MRLAALALALAAVSTTALVAQQADVRILPLRGNVYVLVGAGANITLSVGREGILLVDAGTASAADKVIAAVTQLAKDVNGATVARPCAGLGCSGNEFASLLGTIASPAPPKPLQYIVNTSADSDHTGGNAKVAAAGTTYGGGPGLGQFVGVVKDSATIYAHENVLERMSAAKIATAALPTESYPGDFKQFFNGEGIHMIHLKNAHSDGDSIVHFRASDVISAGDILSTVSYPTFDIAKGGSINGVVRGLNDLLDLAIAEYQTEGGTLIIPGHGRVTNEWEVAEYRDMLVIFRDRIQAMIKNGATLEEVKAARPTADYDVRFGATSGPWTTDMFVEAMYTSLRNPPKSSGAK